MTHWRHEYHIRIDSTERVRWCRQNLGDHGDRWDYLGGKNIVVIYIRSDEDALLYDKHWRFWNVLKGNNKEESHYFSQS
jgi:hypothetical protein